MISYDLWNAVWQWLLPLAQGLVNDDSNSIAMFKNYLLSAFRSFGRNKVFTQINIAVFAIGISTSCSVKSLRITIK